MDACDIGDVKGRTVRSAKDVCTLTMRRTPFYENLDITAMTATRQRWKFSVSEPIEPVTDEDQRSSRLRCGMSASECRTIKVERTVTLRLHIDAFRQYWEWTIRRFASSLMACGKSRKEGTCFTRVSMLVTRRAPQKRKKFRACDNRIRTVVNDYHYQNRRLHERNRSQF